MEKKDNQLNINVPTAIIIAGVLIAGAIIFTNTPKTDTSTNKNTVQTKTIAELVGLNKNKFQACLSSGKFKDRVEADYQDGLKVGTTGTPTTVLMNKNGNKSVMVGALGDEAIKTEIGKLPESTQQVPIAPISDQDHFYGNPDADVVMIEFSDTECPFCKRFHPIVKKIVDESGGKIALVYRHFPLDSLHAKARKEAEATECAAELGGNDKFWDYLDKLLETTPSNDGLDPALL